MYSISQFYKTAVFDETTFQLTVIQKKLCFRK